MPNPNDHILELLARKFRALGDPSRLRILRRLKAEPCHVNALVEELGLAQATVSKHLSVLRDAGLIVTERQGNRATCRVADPSLYSICEQLCEATVQQRTEELRRLGADRPRAVQAADAPHKD